MKRNSTIGMLVLFSFLTACSSSIVSSSSNSILQVFILLVGLAILGFIMLAAVALTILSLSGQRSRQASLDLLATKSKEEIIKTWKGLASEFKGEADENSPSIRMSYKNWTFLIDAIRDPLTNQGRNVINRQPKSTMFEVVYKVQDELQFYIGNGVNKPFGVKKLEAPSSVLFNSRYIVAAENTDSIKKMISNSKVPQLVLDLECNVHIYNSVVGFKMLNYFVRDYNRPLSLPKGLDRIVIFVDEVIIDSVKFRTLLDLAEELLDGLCDIGAASPDKPEVEENSATTRNSKDMTKTA